MTKQQLVQLVAKKHSISRAQASAIVDTIFSRQGIISTELKRGGKVQISGFGHFETRKRAPRQLRNPRTGKTMSIKGSVAPVFRAGKGLKEAVDRK